MRLGIGRLVHGSNTFAIDRTDLSHFESTEMIRGDELLKHYNGTNTVIGGALAACRESGVEAVPLIASSALAGGPLTQDCLEHLVNMFRTSILDSLDEVDGLILELHGAMVSEHHAAADEYFLRQIRRAAAEMPIALVLDSRANVTPGLMEAADIVLGYGAFPHVDAAQRGCRAVELLTKVINEGLAVQTTLKRLSMLIPIAAQSTRRAPMQDILNRSGELQAKKHIHAVSVFGGFPHADVPHAGASVSVVGDRDSVDSLSVAESIGAAIWETRHAFAVHGRNVEEAVHDAMASREGPVVLADLGDNPGDGGPGDGTTLLWALLDLGARDAVLATMTDEQAVEACINAGVDSKIELPVGGRRDTRHGYPIDVRGRVKTITDGKVRLEGPVGAGLSIDMGRTVVLDIKARHDAHVEVVLTERRVETFDLNILRHAGIEPADRKIIALKSSVQYRAAYEPVATEIYEVITPGITTPDPAFYVYRNVQRPVFPLDAM